MSDIAIRVENLSKLYHIGKAQERPDTLRDALTSLFKRSNVPTFKRSNDSSEDTIWALRDVSFEVKRGEVVGVIGRNGAGKSTLLKILSRITEPTSGRAVLNGRVGSLLEVGTGFHPELTGRENVYLSGAILGMRREEIDRKFDEIVAFSGVEKFIDTPFKRYSSGMRVRLGFAVAAHLDPEILLIDEVLAVGDAAFQKKCLGKMGEVAGEGRTVVFVSHNMGAIRSLCERCLWLSCGRVVGNGVSEAVVDSYLSSLTEGAVESTEVCWDLDNAPGSENFRLLKLELVGVDGARQSKFVPQSPIEIHIYYQLMTSMPGMRVVLQILNAVGEIAFTSTDHSKRRDNHWLPGRYISICRIPGGLMNLGEYSVRLWAGIPGVRYLLEPTDFARFSVVGVGSHGSIYADYRKWPGVVCPKLEWNIMAECE